MVRDVRLDDPRRQQVWRAYTLTTVYAVTLAFEVVEATVATCISDGVGQLSATLAM